MVGLVSESDGDSKFELDPNPSGSTSEVVRFCPADGSIIVAAIELRGSAIVAAGAASPSVYRVTAEYAQRNSIPASPIREVTDVSLLTRESPEEEARANEITTMTATRAKATR